MKIKENNYELFCKVGNLYPTPITDGIIHKLFSNTELQSAISNIKGFDVDGIELSYYKRSAEKSISTLCKYLLEEFGLVKMSDYYVPNESFNSYLVKVILAKYLDKWLKLLNTFLLEYEPLSPYHMKVNDDTTKDHLQSKDKTGSEGLVEDKNNNNYFGFNSEDSVPIDEGGSKTKSQDSRTTTYERDVTRSREITRKGNIGNKTNQELITEERKLNMWVFFDEMFKDIDKILANPLWEIN